MPTMYSPDVLPRGGQARINAKRNARAKYWRSVKIRVSAEMEPYFRKTLHLLGDGARIQGCTKNPNWLGFDFDVHLPNIPAGAVRGEPVYYSDWNGHHHVPRVDYIVFHDALRHRTTA